MRRPLLEAGVGLCLLVSLGSPLVAKTSPDERDKMVSRLCELPEEAIVVRDGRVVVVQERLPAQGPNFSCIWRNIEADPQEDRLVFASSEAKIDAAIEKARQAEADRRLRPERIAKVERLIAAVERADADAIRAEGVVGKPYVIAEDRWKSRPEFRATFDMDTLRDFASCDPAKAYPTSADWMTVQWNCPANVAQPWPSTATSFQFDELEIVLVKTGPGAPTVRTVPIPQPRARSSATPTG